MRNRLRLWLAVGAFGTAILGAAIAARGDDRSAAEALLSNLEHDPAHKTLTASLVKRSRDALERATRMQAAQDGAHARIAEGLALEWAQAATDLVNTAESEKRAAATRLAALDAGAHAERERALLEEGIARTGRLRAELDSVEKQKGPSAHVNVQGKKTSAGADAGAGMVEGGAP